jgi:hypothetical protein
MSTSGPVLILQLPKQLDSLATQTFMQEFEPVFDSQRPRIVFRLFGSALHGSRWHRYGVELPG